MDARSLFGQKPVVTPPPKGIDSKPAKERAPKRPMAANEPWATLLQDLLERRAKAEEWFEEKGSSHKAFAKAIKRLEEIDAGIKRITDEAWEKGWRVVNLRDSGEVWFDIEPKNSTPDEEAMMLLAKTEAIFSDSPTPAPDSGGVSFDHLPPPTETESGAKVFDLTEID